MMAPKGLVLCLTWVPYFLMSNDLAYMAKYMLRRYHERRDWAIKRLGGVCAACGTSLDLEMDHINPDDKEFEIGKVWSYSWDKFLKEVDKCQLLCQSCHKEKNSTRCHAKPRNSLAVSKTWLSL